MNADANVMDYSYSVLDVPFKNALQGMFNKAVRVTTAVKEKIGNGFRKHFTVGGIEKQQVELVNKFVEKEQTANEEPKPVVDPTISSPVVERDYLVSPTVDETMENLGILIDKWNALERQKKVITAIKRVALYTKELAALTARVTKKWFGNLEKAESVVSAVESVATPVVPEVKVPEPIVMPIAPVAQEIKAPEPVVVPKFDWNSLMDSVKAKPVEVVAEKEPVSVVSDKPNENVAPFKFDLPSFGMNVARQESKPDMEVKEPVSFKGFETTINDTKSNVLPFEKKEGLNSFAVDSQREELPTRSAINARLYRLSEYIKELTSEVRKLKMELEASKTANLAANDKVAAYDKVNSSLAEKIHALTEQMESLKAELEKAKASRLEIIKSNEEKIANIKADYESQLTKAVDERESIKAEYERKLADANAKYKEEIARVNSDYKQTMQDIYSGMQNIQATEEMPLANSQEKVVDPYNNEDMFSYELPQRQLAA